MSSIPIHFCSLNLGNKLEDYQAVRPTATQADWIAAEIDNANGLIQQRNAFALQEVSTIARPFIEALQNNNFKIIRCKDGAPDAGFDAAIALDKDRFTNITNNSRRLLMYNERRAGRDNPIYRDIAIAQATDRLTGERVTFASFHINGYNFDELQNALRNQTPANLERNIRRGDEFCQRILEAVNQVGAGTLQIMGADMNSNPGNERSIQQKFHQRPLPGRFSVLEGFHRITPLDPTNYNNRDRIADKERTLDFIFVRDKQETMNCWQRFWQWLVSLFRSSYRLESATLEQAQMTLRDVLDDPTRHFSDHLPVEAHVRIQQIAPRLCG